MSTLAFVHVLVCVPGASLYDYLMFGHVLAAMLWLGGWAVLGILAAQALRQRDVASLARFAATIRFIGPRLLAPATVLVVGLGVWLVLGNHPVALQSVLDRPCDRPARRRSRGRDRVSESRGDRRRAAIREDQLDQAMQYVRRWTWGSALIVLLLVAATWDMAVKP